MEPIDPEQVRDSAVFWALWKALDFLSTRYLTPYADFLKSGKPDPEHPAAAATAQAVAATPEALAEASRQLADPDSPVLKALTTIWAQRGKTEADGLAALEEQLTRLAPAEGLVVLGVIAQALKAG